MTASTSTQITSELTTSEQHALAATLGAQQTRVGALLRGLDDAALRRAVLPSGWSALGLLHHLTAMHQFWFRDVLTDDHRPLPGESGPDFGLDHSVASTDLVRAYERETAHALTVIPVLSLDAEPAWWPEEVFGGWRLETQRQVLQHVIVEICTHSGQLDAVRELLDGRTWSYVLGRVAEPGERRGLI